MTSYNFYLGAWHSCTVGLVLSRFRKMKMTAKQTFVRKGFLQVSKKIFFRPLIKFLSCDSHDCSAHLISLRGSRRSSASPLEMFGPSTLLLLTLLFQFGVKPSDGYIKFFHDSYLTTCKSKRVASRGIKQFKIWFYYFLLYLALHRPQSTSSSFWEFLRTIKHDEGKYWKLTGGFTKKSPMRFGRWCTKNWKNNAM